MGSGSGSAPAGTDSQPHIRNRALEALCCLVVIAELDIALHHDWASHGSIRRIKRVG